MNKKYQNENVNPFSICFTSMKIRYSMYDASIDSMNFVNPNDKVNVFINFESVLNNLSMIKDIENKLLIERNFPIILESEAINLCAHYKKFFRGNGLDTNVFLYYTDLDSSNFKNYKYNDEYRSYYANKYMNNPKFQLLGRRLVERIVPRLKTIMDFIPNVYFITGKDIEGSLIPMVIGDHMRDRKNFIISSDSYDTQYQLKDNFCMHYIRRTFVSPTSIFSSFNQSVRDLFKDDSCDISLFNNDAFYTVLKSALGDKMRSIDPLKGIGTKSVLKYIQDGITNGIITKDTCSVEMLTKILPKDFSEKLFDNYHCINLNDQYLEMSDLHKFNIMSQIVDRFDFNSLIQLNQTDYRDYPLMLPELTS